MPPSASTEFNSEEQALLLQLAWDAITGASTRLGDIHPASPLRQRRGVFVTLTREGRLRGCIGQIEPNDCLLQTVPECASGAAFRDRRFPPVIGEELDQITLSISLLSPPEAMTVADRQDLLNQLQPGIDGLVLVHGRQRATFLPSVWEQLPLAEQFLAQLLKKAGLPSDHWSAELSFSRYESYSFTRPGPRIQDSAELR